MSLFLKKFFSFYRPFIKQIIIIVGLVLITQVSWLVGPYIWGSIINALTQTAQTHVLSEKLITFLLLVLLFYVTDEVLDFLRKRYIATQFRFQSQTYIRANILERFLTFSIGQHRNQNSGISSEIIVNGERGLIDLSRLIVLQILPSVIKLLVTIIALFFISWYIGVTIFIGAGIYALLVLFMKRRLSSDLDLRENLANTSSKYRREMIDAAPVAIVHAQESLVITKSLALFRKFSDHARGVSLRLNNLQFWQNIVFSLTDWVALLVGVVLVFRGYYTVGYLVTARFWWNAALNLLNQLGNLYDQVIDSVVSIQKLFTMLELSPAIVEKENAHNVSLHGSIEFSNVTFTYPHIDPLNPDTAQVQNTDEIKKPKPSVERMTFSIQNGQRVAFVGPSGGGKSTIISLLLRGYDPDTGSITVDNVPLPEINTKNYRTQIGLVDQFIYLFDDTLRNNIVFGLGDRGASLTDEQILAYCKLARIDEFLPRLPKGIDTYIGKNGIKLSGGERQRVGIARALIKDPKILILDEATSNLDVRNERLIKQAVDNASKGRTTITIAHRLSTVRDSDCIFVVEHGHIVASGTHDQLMTNSPLYKELVETDML